MVLSIYSFPRLEWPKTEDPFSRPFVGQNWFRLVLLNRINTADVIGYFFLPTGHFSFAPHIHTPSAIRSFQGISSRPFIGENVFWSVPQNRMSTENAVGCLFFIHEVLFFAPHMHTASAPKWKFPTGFVQKQVKWISQQLRNPLDLLLNKSCWKFPWRSGCCVHVWGKEKNFVDKKQALHSIHCVHTVLGH